MILRRYSIKCRVCDGSGIHRGVDEDGNNTLDECECSRGRRTIVLSEEDERDLLAQLEAHRN